MPPQGLVASNCGEGSPGTEFRLNGNASAERACDSGEWRIHRRLPACESTPETPDRGDSSDSPAREDLLTFGLLRMFNHHLLTFVGLHLLKTSKGRDKLCALVQNFSKFWSITAYELDTAGHAVWRGVENNISDGRKIFRFLKFIPEAAKGRDSFRRSLCLTGFARTRTQLECLARVTSCMYYFLDNVRVRVCMRACPRLRACMCASERACVRKGVHAQGVHVGRMCVAHGRAGPAVELDACTRDGMCM